jgi:hypothetical protein
MTSVSPEDLIERLRRESAFFRQNRPVTETTSTTEALCDEAADLITTLLTAGDAMAEALQNEAVLRHGADKETCPLCLLATQWHTMKGAD